MPIPPPAVLALAVAALFLLLDISEAQQNYVNNKQLNCNNNDPVTFGFACNGAATSCPSFLTFRSTPTYNRPDTIANLLAADASQIASANNITDIQTIPDATLVLVPINCSCSTITNSYYQHNASYLIKQQGETYFSISNNTYQALTTCQAMEAQNPYDFRHLYTNMKLAAPLRCACPTPNQTAQGFNYLLTYLVREGDSSDSIATTFAAAGADVDSILAANNLSASQTIYFFTPILVPLRIEPNNQNVGVPASPPPPPQPSPPPAPPSGGSNSNKWIYIGVGAAVLITLASILSIWFFCNRRRKQKPPQVPPPKLADKSGSTTKQFSSWSISSGGIRSAIETLTVYDFEEMEKATDSFAESNRISEGSSVYRASFKGDAAVVKIMKGDVTREIDALRQINHSRVVRLSGFCVHQGLTYLVYEYVENGPLNHWLHPGLSKHSPGPGLDWKQRLQVAYDVADALNYLHNFTNPPYIHKNLTSTNVLLDATMRAKITNFGLAKALDTNDEAVMTRHVVGTYGYMPPEYVESGLITPKLDVYALGVVMLELLSGRKAVYCNSEGEQVMLSQTGQQVLSGENVRGKLREFIDPWLGEDYPLELAYSAAQLAKSCVAHDLHARPALSDVFLALSKLLLSFLEWDPSHDTSR